MQFKPMPPCQLRDSRQSRATESAPPETATATRSPARIDSCFRIVFNSRSASSCTGKWYSSCQSPSRRFCCY